MNGKPGKRAVFVRSSIPNSSNYGKVFVLIKLLTDYEKQRMNIWSFDPVWLIDENQIQWYNASDMTPAFNIPCVMDYCVKILPDLEEDEELIEAKELEKENG